MGNNQSLQLTKQAIGEILKKLKITQVVYVDDVFERSYDIAKIIGWIAEAYNKSPAEIEELIPEISFDRPGDIWYQELRSQWERLDSDRREEVILQLSRILNNQLIEDFGVAGKVKRLFPRKVNFVELSPAAWEQQKDQIIGRASTEKRILCLFDQDLSQAAGFTERGPRSGIGLIQDVVARDASENVICGLFTHTISSLDYEMTTWRKLAEENDLKLDSFLPLAKLRITDANPLLFADGIKKTTLNTFCEKLKSTATDVLNEAYEDAKANLLAIDVYDFDYMVLQSSYLEGEWEANTLLRIFQIFEQDAMRRLMLDAGKSGFFNKTVKIARPISEIKTTNNDNLSHPRITDIRKQELYEESGLIAHSPVQVGDLFEAKNDDGLTQFILLAQPCDLAVRRDGTRSIENLIVPLIPICERMSYEEVSEKKALNYWRTHAPMHYFYEDSSDVAIIAFAKACWISIDVLDLAVLDKAGICGLDLEEEIILPPQLTSGWEIRINKVVEKFRAYRAQLDKLKAHIDGIKDKASKKHIWQSVMPKVSLRDFGLRSESYSDGFFDFGLRRVGRYRQPGASRLLKAYTQFFSRDAEAHDFARPIR